MTSAAPAPHAIGPHWAVHMNWRNRSVFFALLSGVVGLHLFEQQAGWMAWGLLALQFGVYPQLVYWRALRHLHPRRAEVQNMVLDGFCFGLWFAGLGFPLWICFILFTGVCINLVVFMGPVGLLYVAGTVLAGVTLGWAVFWPLTWHLETSLPVTLLCMVLVTLFLVVFARDGYLRSKGLYESRRQLARQLEEIGELQGRLQEMAVRDPLTGLYNRRQLTATLSPSLLRSQAQGVSLSLLLIDVDHFKRINDSHGHATGDAVLQALARLLQHHAGPEDLACRFGGEEFVLVLENTAGPAALERAQRLREDFAALRVAGVHGEVAATLSCGVACYPVHAQQPEALLMSADHALYAAKEQGRNRVMPALAAM